MTFNWGTGIALVYTAFALATSAFVAFAIERHVDLVSPDYYARSLQLDRRMAAERGAAELGDRLIVGQTAPRARQRGDSQARRPGEDGGLAACGPFVAR